MKVKTIQTEILLPFGVALLHDKDWQKHFKFDAEKQAEIDKICEEYPKGTAFLADPALMYEQYLLKVDEKKTQNSLEEIRLIVQRYLREKINPGELRTLFKIAKNDDYKLAGLPEGKPLSRKELADKMFPGAGLYRS